MANLRLIYDTDSDWFMDEFEEPRSVVTYTNTCYICGKQYESTEASEICSDECLAIEDQMPMHGEAHCQNESCTLKATHTIPCRSGR